VTRRFLLRALLFVLACASSPVRAANTPRYAHSATLLATGNVLVAGGVDSAGAVLATSELVLTAAGGSVIDGGAMGFARSSHTATILPDGRVLITGGWGGGATVRNTAELYNPITNSFSAVANNMSSARFNHTATLLNDGRVLVCGGQTDFTPTVTNSCDFFCTSNSQPGCAGNAFRFVAAPSLQAARSAHTAVLLKDGKVWFAGGYNNAAVPTYLATTERFDPTLNLFNSAAPLSQARAYHTATLMGHGKVLVVGGYNGDNSPVNGNSYGILKTAETYDPVGNSIIPAPSMKDRREMHSAVLTAEDVVLIEGGLGNVTTTYLTTEVNNKPLAANSVVNHTFPGVAGTALTTTTVTGGTMALAMDFHLHPRDPDVGLAGRIEDGEIWFSTPSVHVGGVSDTYFTPANEGNPAVGLRASLNGATVGCDVDGYCGYISGTFSFSGYGGQTIFKARSVANITPAAPSVSAGNLVYTNASGNALGSGAGATAAIAAGSNFTATVLFDMPLEVVGATIDSATIQLISGVGSASITKVSSFTAAITAGWGTFSGQTVNLNGAGTGGEVSVNLTLSNLAGTVTADPAAVSVASPQSLATNTTLDALNSGTMRYVASKLSVAGLAFQVDIATVVIRRMVMSAPEYYDPKANKWRNIRPGRNIEDVSYGTRGRFGGTSTLLLNNDVLNIGGRECDDASATCAAFKPKTTGGVRQDSVEYSAFKNWDTIGSGMLTARVFHSATNLPDGTILVAGGSNGPNVLRSAEIYSPTTRTSAFTRQPMHDVRDLHTATLLPNGRVLIAGGFTTNATSTGSTSTSEIYYPDTQVFLRAGSMNQARSNHSAAAMPDGSVMVAGGFGPNDVITNTAEIFYSTAMAWRAAPVMPSARALNTATTLRDGRIMLAGGINSGGVLSSVVAFNPVTGTWAALASMPSALHSHTATLLLDGRVLVAGGNDGFGEADASYIYDPSADAWSATPVPGGRGTILQEPRFGHNALGLPNGDVVISGGSQRFGVLTEAIEYFHITNNIWISSGITFGSLTGAVRPRSYHTLTLAADNQLYAIGGTDGVIGGQGTAFYTTVETAYFTADPDSHQPGGGSSSPRQSTILATSTTPFLPNTLFTVTGQQFRGGTEASGGGAGSANSSFSFPRLILQGVESSGQSGSGYPVDVTTQIYANSGNLDTLDSSVTVVMPATNRALPYGWYMARVGANDIYSFPKAVQVGPAKPTAAPTSVVSTPQGVSSVTWNWTAVAGADGYNIYQTTTGILISTTGTNSFVQTGLAPNTTASILVAAYTLTGDGPLASGATNFTLASSATAVAIASVTFSDLLLEWNGGGNEAGTVWEVSQSTDAFLTAYSTPVPTVLGLTAHQVTMSNLLSATTYWFRVRAFNGAGIAGDFSAVVSTLTRTSLSSVDGSAVSSTQIDWSWQNPGNVVNFKVYNATTGVLIASPGPGALGYSDTPLAVNSRRSILVSVVTSAGEGPLTASATHFTFANPPLAGSPHIAAISQGSFTVNWQFNGNPAYTDYRATVKVSGSSAPLQDVTLTGPALSKTFAGLLPGTLYTSSVAAVNGEGVETAWLVGSTYTLAQPARNVTVTNTTPTSIVLSWDRQSNGPDVQWQVTASSDVNFVPGAVSTSIPFSALFTGNVSTITGLLTGTTYWIRVQGRTPFGTETVLAPVVTTVTFNGGAPSGSLAGEFTAGTPSQITGSLGNGRTIDMRSPAGAFPTTVTMTISSYNVVGTLCPNGVNVALQITDSPALQPLKPILLRFSYTAGEAPGIPASRLVLFRYEPVSGTCVPLETAADGTSVQALLNHFSLFQLGQVTLATDAGTARLFPNPFRASSDGFVTIDHVPPAAHVRVFTLRGELVSDITANSSGLATWSGTNGSGRAVASGLYLVVVEANSSKKIMKLSLIR
jgi:hypothetical protein